MCHLGGRLSEETRSAVKYLIVEIISTYAQDHNLGGLLSQQNSR